MPDLKAVYRAGTLEAAAARLDEFEARWGERYPVVAPAWPRAWEHVVPMFAFPLAIRKMIYTTNALESLHRSLCKIIKTRESFPSDEAAARHHLQALRRVLGVAGGLVATRCKLLLSRYEVQLGNSGIPGVRASCPQWAEDPFSTRARCRAPRRQAIPERPKSQTELYT